MKKIIFFRWDIALVSFFLFFGVQCVEAYQWNFTNSTDNWTARNNDTNLRWSADSDGGVSGRLYVDTCGIDPGMVSPNVSIDASAESKLQINITSYCDNKKVEVWFKNNSSSALYYAGKIDLDSNYNWQTKELEMGGNSNWAGTIIQLRIDPAEDCGSKRGSTCVLEKGVSGFVAFDYIRIVESNGTISGGVRDYYTDVAIGDVAVRLEQNNVVKKGPVYTASNGTYTISDVPPGIYRLTGINSGYQKSFIDGKVISSGKSLTGQNLKMKSEVPSLNTFSLNSGSSTTTSRTVTLNNSTSNNPTHYMASENSSFSGAIWCTYSPSPSFSLSSGFGNKKVYLKLKNNTGESNPASDDIDYVPEPQISDNKSSMAVGDQIEIYCDLGSDGPSRKIAFFISPENGSLKTYPGTTNSSGRATIELTATDDWVPLTDYACRDEATGIASGYDAEVAVSPALLSPPNLIKPVDGETVNTLLLEWGVVNGASGYKLEIDHLSPPVNIDDGNQNNYQPSLNTGSHVWRACTKNNAGICGEWSDFESFIYNNPPLNNPPYFNPSPSLPSTVEIPEKIYFTGTAWDDISLSNIRMDVTKPDGETVEAFTDTLSGQSNKDLSVYWFGSNEVYSGVTGSYTVKLSIIDNSGLSVSKTFFVTIGSNQTCGTLKVSASKGSEIYAPALASYKYKYGPSIILNGDTVDIWAASPDTSPAWWNPDEKIWEDRWDHIVHCRGTMNPDGTIDGCLTEEDWTTVLEATPGSRDRYSTCDPDVFYLNGYYYIGYTSTDQKVGQGATSNDIFVARFNGLPDGSSGVNYAKWNGNGWGGDPQPIIEYNGSGWGKAQPCFVVKDNILYIYYTDNGTKVVTVDATNENWPALIDETKAITIFTNDSARTTYGGKPGPFEVKYIDNLNKFIGIGVSNEFKLDTTSDNYIFVCESVDGINFNPVATSKNYWGSLSLGDGGDGGAHNIGISGDREGHLNTDLINFVAYGFGLSQVIDEQQYKGRWPTYINTIEIDLTQENCQVVSAFSADQLIGNAPFTATFIDQSAGDINSWLWNFGDDITSTLQHPTHEYQNAGTYTVSLTVSGPYDSDTLTKTNLITISGLCGDADNNGSVDIFDALLIAEFDVGLKNQSDIPGFDHCDVDNNGSVNIFDALIIAEYDAKIISILNCE